MNSILTSIGLISKSLLLASPSNLRNFELRLKNKMHQSINKKRVM